MKRLEFRARLIAGLVRVLFSVFRLTWRIEEDSLPSPLVLALEGKGKLLLGHFHEDEWALLGVYSGLPMSVLVSKSKDGEIMSSFLEGLGFRVSRGSSSRGAIGGLRSLIDAWNDPETRMLSLAVDGPRGPRREVKPGLPRLAEEFKIPVVLGAAYADRCWVFRRSWSKAFLPKPFARIRLSYSLLTPEMMDDPSRGTQIIQKALLDAKLMAERSTRSRV